MGWNIGRIEKAKKQVPIILSTMLSKLRLLTNDWPACRGDRPHWAKSGSYTGKLWRAPDACVAARTGNQRPFDAELEEGFYGTRTCAEDEISCRLRSWLGKQTPHGYIDVTTLCREMRCALGPTEWGVVYVGANLGSSETLKEHVTYHILNYGVEVILDVRKETPTR